MASYLPRTPACGFVLAPNGAAFESFDHFGGAVVHTPDRTKANMRAYT
jgi:hypothetical protein